MFCAYTRLRYQMNVYMIIVPLVVYTITKARIIAFVPAA